MDRVTFGNSATNSICDVEVSLGNLAADRLNLESGKAGAGHLGSICAVSVTPSARNP
jgi:hypothetical protein